MANALRNAGAADGTDGWDVTGGGAALTVDDAQYGWDGKALFLNQGVATADGQSATIYAVDDNRVAVSPGDELEAFAFSYASKGTGALLVQWEDSGGSVLSNSTVPLVRAQMASGSPELGAWSTLDWSWGRVTAPASAAWARLRYKTTVPTTGNAFKLMLLHPFLGTPVEITPNKDEPAKWDPGAHANTDLDLAAWPDDVPRIQAGAQAETFPNRASMDTDGGIPASRLLYFTPQHSLRVQMRCLDLHLARLEAFHQRGLDEFWFVRPDTGQLCIGKWLADGAPKVVDRRGPWLTVECGLHLKVQ